MKLKIVYVLIAVFICLGQGVILAEENELAEYLGAWTYYSDGDTEKALDIIKKYCKPDCRYEGWAILLGAIYYSRQDRYQDALETINRVRPEVEKKYDWVTKEKGYMVDDPLREEKIQLIKFNYYKMLVISGLSNYELKNWTVALKDLLAFSKEHQETFIYDYTGMCYYETNQYLEAIAYFKRAYQLHEDGELKDTAAYNIGAMNALLGNVEEAICWLRIPLEHNRKLWLGKIETDKDFDTIRDDKKFEDFLKQSKLN